LDSKISIISSSLIKICNYGIVADNTTVFGKIVPSEAYLIIKHISGLSPISKNTYYPNNFWSFMIWVDSGNIIINYDDKEQCEKDFEIMISILK
jgi:hypothetical protein